MAKVATIQDQFPGTSFAATWNAFNAQTTCNNGVVITHPASSATYSGITSATTYDATSSFAVTWLTSAGNQSLTSLEVFPVQFFLGGGTDSNSNVAFYINQNNLSASYDTGAGTQFKNTTTYNPALHRYFRLSESGGTLTWATSPDGQRFTTFYSVADPITLTAVTVQLFAGTYASEASGTTITYAQIGFYGPVARPKDIKQAVKRAAYY
jgi:hypothetical protein